MVSGQQAQAGAAAPPEREYPPIAELSVGSMALVIIGGVYIASYAPKTIPLLVPTLLVIGAGAVLAVNLVLLRGLREFAWRPFFLVFRWTLLAYLVIAGMIGYVFVVDGTRGSQLVVLILMLAIFAVDIPLLLSFSVARYQEPGD